MAPLGQLGLLQDAMQKVQIRQSTAPLAQGIQARRCRRCLQVQAMSVVADKVQLPVLRFDGEVEGTADLALKVADPAKSNGLVHKYIVLIRQNARAPKDFTIKMNKKERRLALSTALQSAADAITVVDDLHGNFTEPKTKALVSALERLGVAPEEHVLVIVDELTEALQLAGRNMERLVFNKASALNAYDILRADRIIMEQAALTYVTEYFASEPQS